MAVKDDNVLVLLFVLFLLSSALKQRLTVIVVFSIAIILRSRSSPSAGDGTIESLFDRSTFQRFLYHFFLFKKSRIMITNVFFFFFFTSRHWQLRSLISAERRHLIYFPGGLHSKQIQRLNTMTHECETIKQLNFAPRCLVVENGWLCCGSENGDFVAVRLDEGIENGGLNNLPLNLDPELRLPMGFETSREESLLSLITHARRSTKSLSAKSMKLATDRINCITLWFPNVLAPAAEEAYLEPIGVLADNHSKVSLVSLRDFEQHEKIEPLDVITYPDFVNRAIISPDGQMLIAILDDPFLYVHIRTPKPADPTTSSRSTTHNERFEWKLRQRVFLKSQKKEDTSDSRGSFAACFSNSGSLLAVGTQQGTISVFDCILLCDPLSNPLITTFNSSRPESGPGAIRDMSFCPGPFDILAWTEDRGHVGIADVRMNFTSRQIVDIDIETDFDHINVYDPNAIDPRILEAHGSSRRDPTTSSLSNRPDGLSPPRRDGDGSGVLNQPLTASETAVLEAMQMQGDRRRRDRPTQRLDNLERSVPDLSWTYLSSLRPPAAAEAESSTRTTHQQRSSSVTRRERSALDDYLDQRERLRNRQASRDAAERQQALRRSEQRWIDRLGETVAAVRDQREQRERPDSSTMNILEILQARERGSTDAENDESVLVPLVNQVVNRWEESAMRGTLTGGTLAANHGVFEVPTSPDHTAGLAWSEDGRMM